MSLLFQYAAGETGDVVNADGGMNFAAGVRQSTRMPQDKNRREHAITARINAAIVSVLCFCLLVAN